MPSSDEVPTILGKALRGELTDREIALIGLSDETKRAITRLIETSPALEEAVLGVADLCYRDGLDAASLGYGEPLPDLPLKLPEPEPPLAPAGPAAYCVRCARSGVGVCDDYPDCPAGAATCPVCHNRHNSAQVVKVGKTSLIPGHEYIIVTKTSLQKYPREWRMGYLGYTAGLQFSARGPDRTHSAQYGGTQTIDMDQVISVTEVERDDVKRHVGSAVKHALGSEAGHE
jgi:hypothetical protein